MTGGARATVFYLRPITDGPSRGETAVFRLLRARATVTKKMAKKFVRL